MSEDVARQSRLGNRFEGDRIAELGLVPAQG